jgi:ligand-binding sensor domain-containing protein
VAVRLILVGITCLWWVGAALALDPDKHLWQYNTRTWTRQNGLPVNGINAVAQTRDGYLWFGSSVGLIRFDGTEFTLHDLSRVAGLRSTIVTSLVPADDGFWVGLKNDGFGFHDGRSFNYRGQESWSQLRDVSSLVQSEDGMLWFAAQSGAGRLTPTGVYQDLLGAGAFTNAPNLLCNQLGREGRVWFGTDGQGVFCWQEGKVTRLVDPELHTASPHSVPQL